MSPSTNTSQIDSTRFLIPLWASAFLIAALIILQAGRLPAGPRAHAEMATTGMEYAMMTTQGGNEEILYILDKRSGHLLFYEPTSSQGMKLLDVVRVDDFVSNEVERIGK